MVWRRHTQWSALAAGLFVTIVTVGWMAAPRPCLPWADTFAAVREGMTFDEIVTAVGRPPGSYTRYRSTCMVPAYGFIGIGPPPRREVWDIDDGMLCVSFDDQGSANAVHWWFADPARTPPLRRLVERFTPDLPAWVPQLLEPQLE